MKAGEQPASEIDKIVQQTVGQIGLQVVNELNVQQIMQVPLAQLGRAKIMQVPLAQITWYHHITLLHKVKEAKECFFYKATAFELGQFETPEGN